MGGLRGTPAGGSKLRPGPSIPGKGARPGTARLPRIQAAKIGAVPTGQAAPNLHICMEDHRHEAAEKEAATRRATDAQVLEDAERLIAAWNERQALHAPMIFSPTIGAATRTGYWFMWVRCPACQTNERHRSARARSSPPSSRHQSHSRAVLPLMPAERSICRAGAAIADKHRRRNARGASSPRARRMIRDRPGRREAIVTNPAHPPDGCEDCVGGSRNRQNSNRQANCESCGNRFFPPAHRA